MGQKNSSLRTTKFIAEDKKNKKKTQNKKNGIFDFAICEKQSFCVEIKRIAHRLIAKEISNKAKIAPFSMHNPFLHKRIE